MTANHGKQENEASIPAEYQGLIGDAKKRYEANLEHQRRIQEEHQKRENARLLAQQKTIEMGRWAAQLLVKAGVKPDFYGVKVLEKPKKVGLFKQHKTPCRVLCRDEWSGSCATRRICASKMRVQSQISHA